MIYYNPTNPPRPIASRQGTAIPLYHITLLNNHNGGRPLAEAAARANLTCRIEDDRRFLQNDAAPDTPDAVILDLESLDTTAARRIIEHCRARKIPAIAAIPRDALTRYDPALNPDELLIHPTPDDELTLRIKQAIYRVNGPAAAPTLAIGDLTIDLERYEVSAAGRRVTLTYKEFQLLALLASNPGRVYTREALLSQVWGYDYLGGTRTVDVHVRRLRSKLESPGRSFIETIWNVGYRFKPPP